MRDWLQRFFMGRYGNDQLNHTMILASLVLFIVHIFLPYRFVLWLGYIFWGFSLFRMFSRNTYQRNNENIVFLQKTKGLRHQFQCFTKGLKDKEHKYFICPNCGQIVRVPKGRGHIEIRCPKCQHHFDRKS